MTCTPYDYATRKPKRISITVAQTVIERLEQRSFEEGRSTSNLAAYLLETALAALDKPPPPIQKRW